MLFRYLFNIIVRYIKSYRNIFLLKSERSEIWPAISDRYHRNILFGLKDPSIWTWLIFLIVKSILPIFALRVHFNIGPLIDKLTMNSIEQYGNYKKASVMRVESIFKHNETVVCTILQTIWSFRFQYSYFGLISNFRYGQSRVKVENSGNFKLKQISIPSSVVLSQYGSYHRLAQGGQTSVR